MRERNWSESEVAYLTANYGRIKTREIAQTVGRSAMACKVKANRMGYFRQIRRISDREYHEVIKTMASAVGVTPAAVLRGDRSRKCVIARWATWLELRARGYSQDAIAFVSGFTQQAIFNGTKSAKTKDVDKCTQALATSPGLQ